MTKLYRNNLLKITEINPTNIKVDAGDYGEILLRDAPENVKIDDEVSAFVYIDSSDDVVATMVKAYAQIGECAHLEVISTGRNGTYLNWGLPKDLLLPSSEQVGRLREGHFCVVHIFEDDDGLPIASMKLHRYLDEYQGKLKEGDQVDLMIAGETDIGFKAIINNEQLGVIYHQETSQHMHPGTKIKGWVKEIREDGKINLNLNTLDKESRSELEEEILEELEFENGRLYLSDKSSPDDIYKRFQVSKKNFKRALGSLYKQRLIKISPEYIEIIK